MREQQTKSLLNDQSVPRVFIFWREASWMSSDRRETFWCLFLKYINENKIHIRKQTKQWWKNVETSNICISIQINDKLTYLQCVDTLSLLVQIIHQIHFELIYLI